MESIPTDDPIADTMRSGLRPTRSSNTAEIIVPTNLRAKENETEQIGAESVTDLKETESEMEQIITYMNQEQSV